MRTVLMAVVVILVVFVPTAARADLILAGDAGGTLFCATDNNSVCTYGVQLVDTNAGVGILSLATANVGGLLVEGSLHTADTTGGNLLTSSSLSITNTLAVAIALIASISATDFIGPATSATTTGSGTWTDAAGSSTTYTWWNDPTNQQGGEDATDRPGTLIDAFSDTAGAGLDSFSHNGGPFPVSDLSAFSMTLGFDLVLLAGDQFSVGASRSSSRSPPFRNR